MDRFFLICALAIAVAGAVNDVRTGRIPNRLTYGGTLAALAVRYVVSGWPGLKDGLLGLLVAGGIFYFLFLVQAMGGGDMKLIAAVGAWAGTTQAMIILIVSALAGGILAVSYIVCRRQVRQTIVNSATLILHHVTSGIQPHPVLNVREPSTMRVPFALAIAMGTLYCVGNAFLRR
jgi:prepilin peptidase CpaA